VCAATSKTVLGWADKFAKHGIIRLLPAIHVAYKAHEQALMQWGFHLTITVQMYARQLLLQQQQQQQRQRVLLAQQQLFKGNRPLDMGAFGLDSGRGNPAAMNQGPRGVSGKPNVSLSSDVHL